MEQRQSSFEDHMSIVENAHSKTASADPEKSSNLLAKIAEQLNPKEQTKVAEGAVTAPGAPTAEGEVSPAASSVAGAAPAVAAATEAVTMPQTTIAGGNPAESAAGEVPAATKPNEGVAISAGDGSVTDSNNLNRTPESVAAAAIGGGGDEGAAATPAPEKAGEMPDNDLGAEKTAEAVSIGKVIANTFQDELEKSAQDNQYSECLDILKEAGLMEGYDIKDEGMSKTASLIEGSLEKIANKQTVSREEIISAAIEYVELEKEASDTEEQAREDAREQVAATAKSEQAEQEKIASAIQDPKIVAAVQVLKDAGIV